MKIGILGLGSIGSRHFRNLQRLGHDVIGYDPQATENELSRDDLLCWADAFVIASPTTEHWQDLIDTRIANKPTFAEKPLSNRLRSIDDNYPHVIMVGYNLRFHGVVKSAKEYLPKIGKPIWANFCCGQFNEKPVYRRDGVVLNWSHEIDLALYLLGHGRCISASINETDSLADINILHNSGCRTVVHLDYLTKPEQRYFKIVCEGGYLHGTLAPGRYLHFLTMDNLGPENDSKQIHANDSYDENYLEEMQAFIDRIVGMETIGATCQDGKDVLEICMDAKMGHWQG